VRNRGSFSIFRWLSLAMVFLALILMIFQLIGFSRIWANFPAGLRIAGIPVGLLDRQQASERLLEIYTKPVELQYNDSIIHLSPSVVSFELDLESMLAAAENERTRLPFWQSFWNYLWGRTSEPADIPLRSTVSEERLRAFLETEVATRYDKPPQSALPVPGSVTFQPGDSGTVLDVERSISLIEEALISNQQRVVNLPLQQISPGNPTLQNLEILLKQIILDVHNYDGSIGFYMANLQTGQEISFYLEQKELLSVPPDLSFTASSVIKIPILVSAYRRLEENQPNRIVVDEDTLRSLEEMITKSDNQASDRVMQNVIDSFRGPLSVTDDMQELGLENTFLAGFFYTGAPLMQVFRTPGNQRVDTYIERDPYSQTTPIEIGILLQDIYQCAETGGGSLAAVFPGELTQTECQQMIQFLKNDRTPWLILAGVPDGTEVAHKHGWVSDAFGIIHDMSDAGIVFTRGGDYVLSIFLYHPVQLVFEPANELVSQLSQAVYNYYNLPQQ
jgi:beta-lactamase class A